MQQLNNLNENIGENIRLHRIRRGLTIKKLCKRIYESEGFEIKVASIRNYEKGLEKIPATTLVLIAKLTKTPLEDFYTPANDAVLLDTPNKLHLLEAYSLIPSRSEREAVLHLVRRLGR